MKTHKMEIDGQVFTFKRDQHYPKMWNTFILKNGIEYLCDMENESLKSAKENLEHIIEQGEV